MAASPRQEEAAIQTNALANAVGLALEYLPIALLPSEFVDKPDEVRFCRIAIIQFVQLLWFERVRYGFLFGSQYHALQSSVGTFSHLSLKKHIKINTNFSNELSLFMHNLAFDLPTF